MQEKKSLHIAFFIDDFYPDFGGVSRSVQTQVGELVRLGHRVTLFAPKHQLNIPDNCEIYITPSIYMPGTPGYMCSLQFGKHLAEKICRSYSFDAVHTQTERGGLALAARIAKLQNIPHIHTFHANIAGIHAELPILSFINSTLYSRVLVPIFAHISPLRASSDARLLPDTSEPWIVRRDWQSLARIAARVDYFVTPSHFMMESISSCLPEDYKSHGSIISTGINPVFLDALPALKKKENGSKKIRFLSMGRLAKEKRIDAVIQAFLKAAIPDAELHVVGSGDQEKTLKRLAGKHRSIHFHPHVKDIKEVASHYSSADVFVLASYGFDNQPITLIEATAAGLPIVYCDPRLTVGVSEKNSLLTKSPDVKDIAEAFTTMADSRVRNRLAVGSREERERLSPESMAKRYLELYHKSPQ